MSEHSLRRLERLATLAAALSCLAVALAIHVSGPVLGGTLVCRRLEVRHGGRRVVYLGPTASSGTAVVRVAGADGRRVVELAAGQSASVRVWDLTDHADAGLMADQRAAGMLARWGRGERRAETEAHVTSAGDSSLHAGRLPTKEQPPPLAVYVASDGDRDGLWPVRATSRRVELDQR
ncbi:MAG: hypothetical protein HZB16_10300 [Armatimonadetes bacterium]|nr:hypothetical protein [Armatimonadota bacterium]